MFDKAAVSLEALAGRKVAAVAAVAAAAVVRVVALVVVAPLEAIGAATAAVVAVAGMGAVGVAAATRLTREVGAGAAGLAVLVAAAACAFGAEALRCCRAVLAVMVRLVLEAVSVRWRPLMRVDAASRQKQLPREQRRQATSLHRRAVLLPCVEAVAEALRLQRVGHCAGCAGHCAGHCDLRICTPQPEVEVVVFLTPRRRNVVAPTMLDSFWAIGRSAAKVAAARHRQGAAYGGCSLISAHGACVRPVHWAPMLFDHLWAVECLGTAKAIAPRRHLPGEAFGEFVQAARWTPSPRLFDSALQKRTAGCASSHVLGVIYVGRLHKCRLLS